MHSSLCFQYFDRLQFSTSSLSDQDTTESIHRCVFCAGLVSSEMLKSSTRSTEVRRKTPVGRLRDPTSETNCYLKPLFDVYLPDRDHTAFMNQDEFELDFRRSKHASRLELQICRNPTEVCDNNVR